MRQSASSTFGAYYGETSLPLNAIPLIDAIILLSRALRRFVAGSAVGDFVISRCRFAEHDALCFHRHIAYSTPLRWPACRHSGNANLTDTSSSQNLQSLSGFKYQTVEVSAVRSHMTKGSEICVTHLPFLIPRIPVV
jgi:hypothetical protein